MKIADFYPPSHASVMQVYQYGRPVEGHTITLLSMDHPQVVAVTDQTQDRRFKMRQQTMTAAALRNDNIETLVAATREWTGFVGDDDQPLKCEPVNIRKLYQSSPSIRRQVDNWIAGEENFAPAS